MQDYVCVGVVILGVMASIVIPIVLEANKNAEARRQAREALADAELQRNHPELWGQKETLKLEKERLAAQKELAEQQLATQKQLAEERAKQENLRHNVGLGVGIGRMMGWW